MTIAPAAAPAFEAGGGGLYSTADDYLVFSRMLLGEGEVGTVRLLSPEMTRLMLRNHLSDRQREMGGLNRSDFFAHAGFGYGVLAVMRSAPPVCTAIGTDYADISSGPDRRDPNEVSPADRLQAEVEQMAWKSLASRHRQSDGWTKRAPRHRNRD
eukprot:gene61212-83726_t